MSERQEIHWTQRGCSDGYCIVERPKGMATNGGCQHLKADKVDLRRTLQCVAKQRDEVKKKCEKLQYRADVSRAMVIKVANERDHNADLCDSARAEVDRLKEKIKVAVGFIGRCACGPHHRDCLMDPCNCRCGEAQKILEELK